MRLLARRRDYMIVLGALCLSAALVAENADAQAKKVSGKLENLAVRARTDLFLAENPLDTGRLQSVSRTLTSSDPLWDRAQAFSVSFSDPFMRQEGRYSGHTVINHASGEQTFLVHEVRWRPRNATEGEWETTGHFVGGTGRFTGITGTWRGRGTSTLMAETGEWEAEYELR